LNPTKGVKKFILLLLLDELEIEDTSNRTQNTNNCPKCLSVRLGDSLELVLLLDSETVAAALGGVHELVGQALGNGFDVSEGGVLGAGCDEPDGLVDASHWRHIASLSSYGTSSTDSGAVFSWTAVHDGGDADLDWVLAGHDVDDLESVLDDSHGEHLLTVVSAFLHEGVDKSLDDMALRLSESGLVESGRVVWQVLGVLLVKVDVIGESHILALDFREVPFAKKLWLVEVLLDGELLSTPVLFLLLLWSGFSPIFVSHFFSFFFI